MKFPETSGLASLVLVGALALIGLSCGSEQPTGKQSELVYAQSQAITSLETAGSQPQGYPSGYEAAFAIYDGLVRMDNELNFRPGLATEWSTSEDGLSWTFKLRKGVTFHDGTPFNADAVVSHFERMLDPDINIGTYALWSPISGVEKLDDYTIEVTTKEPYEGLLNVMAHGSGLIPSPAAVEKYGKDYKLHPVGTGPYQIEKFDPGTELVLQRNGDYFGGKPGYERITFRYVADPSSRIAALQSGQTGIIDAIPVENVEQVKQVPDAEVVVQPGLQVFGVGLNHANPILRNAKVRRAMNYAVDKEAIVRTLLKGYATVLDSPLASNIPGHASVGNYDYSPGRAERLLREAGWSRGDGGILQKNGQKMSFTLLTPEGAYPKDVLIAEFVQSQLKKVGIQVELQKVEAATYWDNLKVSRKKSRAYDMVLWGYNPSHGDAYLQLNDLFRTNPSTEKPPTVWNYIWYSNQQVDKLLTQARQTIDEEKRTKVLGQAEKEIWTDAPYIWLFSNRVVSARARNVQGVEVMPTVFTLVAGARPQ